MRLLAVQCKIKTGSTVLCINNKEPQEGRLSPFNLLDVTTGKAFSLQKLAEKDVKRIIACNCRYYLAINRLLMELSEHTVGSTVLVP